MLFTEELSMLSPLAAIGMASRVWVAPIMSSWPWIKKHIRVGNIMLV